MKLIPKFKALKCPKCGMAQTSESLQRVRCVYCGKTSQFRVRGQQAVKLVECRDGLEAARVCSEWNKKEVR